MATPITWSASLPQDSLYDGFQYQHADNTISFETASGLTRSRRRSTVNREQIRVSMALTAAQKATWLTFWGTTLKGGAIPVSFPDPISGSNGNFYIKSPSLSTQAPDYFRLNFTLAPL